MILICTDVFLICLHRTPSSWCLQMHRRQTGAKNVIRHILVPVHLQTSSCLNEIRRSAIRWYVSSMSTSSSSRKNISVGKMLKFMLTATMRSYIWVTLLGHKRALNHRPIGYLFKSMFNYVWLVTEHDEMLTTLRYYDVFRVTGHLWGESAVNGGFPHKEPIWG